MAFSENIWNIESMSPAEMTLHIRELESIILDLMAQSRHGGQPIRSICVNAALHHGTWGTDIDRREHPHGLELPHYIWQPMIAWDRNLIHLHPENKGRA